MQGVRAREFSCIDLFFYNAQVVAKNISEACPNNLKIAFKDFTYL